VLDILFYAQDIDQELLVNEAEETHLPEDSQNMATSFYASSSGAVSRYPPDGKEFMRKNGPIDQQYVVPDADLIILEQWDARFYYVYRLRSPHPHIQLNKDMPDASKYINETWVYIVDTSPEQQKQRFQFEETLSVPIGPDSLMNEIGEEKMMTEAQIKAFDDLQTDLIGPEEEATLDLPMRDENRVLRGGTWFERTGAVGINGTRCYPMGSTTQHSRTMWSPHCFGKVLEFMDEQLRFRKRFVKLHAEIGAFAMKICLPKKVQELYQCYTSASNIPRLGVEDNCYFQALQLNISPAIPWENCFDTGLVGMGIFGQIQGHRDDGDDPAGYTCMMSNTNVPEGSGTEMGRFFVLNNFLYIKMRRFYMGVFNGLFKHGGSPIILGQGIELKKNFYRINAILYSPRFMLSGAGQYSIGFASMLGKLFKFKFSSNKGIITKEAN
ncbi:hypothetical protein K443DRAFT_628290, partial [Laccaria amethystina LaAM-08-1]